MGPFGSQGIEPSCAEQDVDNSPARRFARIAGLSEFLVGHPRSAILAQSERAVRLCRDRGPRPREAAAGRGQPARRSGWTSWRGKSPAFRDGEQARAVLRLALDEFPGRLSRVSSRPAVSPERRRDLAAFFSGPSVRGHSAAGGTVGRKRADRRRGDRPIERLSRTSAGGRAAHRPAHRALSARMDSADSAVRARGRRERGPLSRDWSSGRSTILRATDPGVLRERLFRSRTARRTGGRSAGVRLRPSGEQAAQLSFRPMGSAPSRQPGPLPPVRRAASHARRAAGAGRRSRAS